MSFIEKNPLIVSKPEVPQKPANFKQELVHKMPSQDESFFKDRPRVSKREIEKSLEKDRQLRGALRRELRLSEGKDLNKQIDNIKEKLSGHYGSYITKLGAKKLLGHKEYWDEKRDIAEKMKGGITPQEKKEIDTNRGVVGFLKKKFGIK